MCSSSISIANGFLTTQPGDGGQLLGTIPFLQANTGYSFTIYVTGESFGSTFSATTAPARMRSLLSLIFSFSPLTFFSFLCFFLSSSSSSSSSFLFLSYTAVSSLVGERYDNTSVILTWNISPGTTQYNLTVAIPFGAFISSTTFNVTNSTIVADLDPGVVYEFTIYSGNSFGIDMSEGSSVQASTFSEAFSSYILFFHDPY